VDVRRLFQGTFDKQGQTLSPGKSILMMGDSLMRGLYKDLLFLTNPDNKSRLTPVEQYRRNREFEYQHDCLLNRSYGTLEGRAFREERDFWSGFHEPGTDMQVSYIFLTQCYSDYVEDLIKTYPRKYGSYPDLILINSALWDITRWGGKGIDKFKSNMIKLMDLFKAVLPLYTQVIWLTTPPLGVNIRGGFLLKHLQFQAQSMKFHVMESNVYAANVVASAGYDVLDMHYNCHKTVFRRCGDGIHWNPDGVRYQTNTWLTHYCLSRNLPLPNKWKKQPTDVNCNLDQAIQIAEVADTDYLTVANNNNQPTVSISDRKFVKARRRVEIVTKM